MPPAALITDAGDLANPPGDAAARFSRDMAAIGNFEAAPHLAVAVSGGADSMALCLLAARLGAARGGRVTALTVDHGLRPGSAAESRRVAGWMRRAGIDHHILTWAGAKPVSRHPGGGPRRALPPVARLVPGGRRVLHLLLGHHRRDQAETVLHRLLRGSGLSRPRRHGRRRRDGGCAPAAAAARLAAG